MSGICEIRLMLMLKKFGILGALSELLEPHLFGRTGGSTPILPNLGLHLFRIFSKSQGFKNSESIFCYGSSFSDRYFIEVFGLILINFTYK